MGDIALRGTLLCQVPSVGDDFSHLIVLSMAYTLEKCWCAMGHGRLRFRSLVNKAVYKGCLKQATTMEASNE